LLLAEPVRALGIPIFFSPLLSSLESEKLAVELFGGSLKFGNLGIALGEMLAEIGVFLSEGRGASFELEEESGIEGRGREAVEVSEFAVQIIWGHREGKKSRGRRGLWQNQE
jgi:hypothetical protein